MIDLRSDTVTRPSPEMREAIARAEVGDDVYADDPTANALEAEIAEITGMEAAIFVSSGTMGNQLAIALHTRPGDEVIIGDGAHPAFFESGAGPALSGIQFRVAGSGGLYTADEMEAAIEPTAYYAPRTSLVCVENTHNRAGGRVFPQVEARAIAERAKSRGLGAHLDGARIWNASVATGLSVRELCAPFDTVSVCFSKGLGAPVGSALCGSRARLAEARRIRKRWGGGMRQVGLLAAAARYALTHNRARIADDHANARVFATKVALQKGAHVDPATIETNIVNIDVDAAAEAVSQAALRLGLAINATGPRRLRAVTHLDVSRADAGRAAEILGRAIAEVA
jgi:threonine aldolase